MPTDIEFLPIAMPTTALDFFNPDQHAAPVLALNVAVAGRELEFSEHAHRKGQLVVALHGGVSCQVPDALWMVPPNCGVWLPGGLAHSNRATANARLCFLFVEPGLAALPERCCTLALSPMLREMILHLAEQPSDYAPDSRTGRLARVLLEELVDMPVERLYLPTSREPRIRRLGQALTQDPGDRSTQAEWARRLATSERTLARLILRETGLSFGRWRQQLQLLVALRELAAGASVQQVSGDLGYASASAFISMFRKALGKSPARYFAELGRG